MFTAPRRTWLSASVLSPNAASYVAYLQRHGYSAPIAGAYLHAVGHFAHWLTEEHLTLRRVDESVVRRFLTTHLPNCQCPGRCQRTVVVVQAALGHLLNVLRAEDRITARRVGMSPAIHDELERFTTYLAQVCGLAAKTRADRRWWVGQLLADRFSRGPIAVDRLTTRDVVDFLVRHGTHYTPGTAGARGCALRSYLRFRAVRCADRVDAFIAAIPKRVSTASDRQRKWLRFSRSELARHEGNRRVRPDTRVMRTILLIVLRFLLPWPWTLVTANWNP